jgi:hypothetical protein
MRNAIFAACGALTLASAMTLSAQTPARPQTPNPAPSTPSRTDDKTITVTGCLKAWDQATGTASATAPSTSAPAPAAKFVLTNIEADSGTRADGAKPSTGTAGKQYIVTAADSTINLSTHLNHKVRLTGKVASTMEHATPSTTTRPSDPAKPDQPARTDMDRTMDKSWSTLAVSSLTMVSANCPSATN